MTVLSSSSAWVLRRAACWRTSRIATTIVGETTTCTCSSRWYPAGYVGPKRTTNKNGGSICGSSRGITPLSDPHLLSKSWHSIIPAGRLDDEQQPNPSRPRQDQFVLQQRYYHTTPHRPVVPLILGCVALAGGYVAYRKLLGESVIPEEATRAKEAYQKLQRNKQDSRSNTLDHTSSKSAAESAQEVEGETKKIPLPGEDSKDR